MTVLLGIGALVLFVLAHIPAYLIRFDGVLADLSRIFVNGSFFLIVYLLTRNLFFTVLCHAFINSPLYLVESNFYYLYFYISVSLVSIAWGLWNWRIGRSL